MHLLDGTNTTPTMPAMTAAGPSPGWCKAEGEYPPTQITGEWVNAVTAESKNLIENQGMTLDKSDNTQVYKAVVAACVSSATTVGAVSTLHSAAALVSANAVVGGDRSLVAASTDAQVSGDFAAVVACDLSAEVGGIIGNACAMVACDSLAIAPEIGGIGCAAVACRDPEVTGLFSLMGGSSTGAINCTSGVMLGSANSKIRSAAGGTTPQNVVMLASRFCDFDLGANGTAQRQYAVAGGYHASSLTAPSWRIESNGGTMRSTAAHTTSGLDYAEMVPNAEGVEHGFGCLLALRGDGVALAVSGDICEGVVSANPTIVGGDDGLGWAHRYLRDEWGGLLTEDVDVEVVLPPDPEANREWLAARARLHAEQRRSTSIFSRLLGTKRRAVARAEEALAALPKPSQRVERQRVTQLVVNPEWKPGQEQVSRRDRRAQWTCMGFVGQMHVRVDASVVAGAFVVPGSVPGVGTRGEHSDGGRRIRVRKILSEWDEARGYAIALCHVG